MHAAARRTGPVAGAIMLLSLTAAVCSCDQTNRPPIAGAAPTVAAAEGAEPQEVFGPSRPVVLSAAGRPPAIQIDVLLRVLQVQIPRAARGQTEPLWDYLREDQLDVTTQSRLAANGLRAAVGRTDQWETLCSILNQIEGARAYELQPLRLPPATPLSLAIDRQPVDQTLFFIDVDGVVSGDSWPASQKALRISYVLDTRELGRLILSVVPAVWQQAPAELSYSEQQGWTAEPRETGRIYSVAGFALPVKSEQFILLAPGPNADLPGMLGGEFLTGRVGGELYDLYVFIRAEVRNVEQRR